MQRVKDESRIHRVVGFSDKPQIGVPLGKFRITIRLAGQRNHTELEGNLYDCTSMFLNPLLVADFKDVICEEIAFTHPEIRAKVIDVTPIREETVGSENDGGTSLAVDPHTTLDVKPTDVPIHSLNGSLKDAVKAFREFPLSSVCRVLIMEHGFGEDKDIILQFGRLHPLTDYASIPDAMSRSFVGGQRGVQCVVNGEGLSLPTRRELPDGLGEGFIHWMIPDDPVWDSTIDIATLGGAQIMLDVVPWVHHDVEYAKIQDAYEDRIKSKGDAIDEMSDDLKAKSVEIDRYKKMLAGFNRHGKNEGLPKGLDLMDFICYALPTTVCFFLGYGIGNFTGSVAGLFIGLVTGAWFSFRRR